LLARHAVPDARLVVGPGIGLDAAVIEMGDRLLVAKTDPVTFAADQIGWYAVHVNANDVATLGAAPRWFLATLLLPEGKTDAAMVEAIFHQIHGACRSLGVALCGGHTEVTLGLDRPLVAGVMLGELPPQALIRPDGALAGDRILLTKGIAIEGTAVLAREHRTLRACMGREELNRCAGFLVRPGISVVPEALRACAAARLHAMHDPTEGGIATALVEMAEAADLGVRVRRDDILVLPETRKVCDLLGLDPMGLLASGALLMAVAPEDAAAVLQALDGAGIAARDIGEFVEAPKGAFLLEGGRERPMPVFQRDEVARALGTKSAGNRIPYPDP
jgi:hydrogenase maturation factor